MHSNNKLNLSSLNRCDQLWENMTPTEKGRICEKCQETIIDFRNYTELEIARTHTFTDGIVCGLYTKEQLKQPTPPRPRKRKTVNALYFSLLGFFLSDNVNAQAPEKTVQTTPEYQSKRDTIPSPVDSKASRVDSVLISGKITDLINQPLFGASILVKDSDLHTFSDFDGQFSLNVPMDTLPTTIAFSYVGLLTQEMNIDVNNLKGELIHVRMIENTALVYGVTIQPPRKRFWARVKTFFRWRKR